MSALLEGRDLEKTYRQGPVTLPVLRGVTVKVEPGAFLAVSGPSGAGKSTLLHLLVGLDTPTRGEVLWEGRAISGLRDAARSAARNRLVGMVFQFYYLLPELSALENVMLPGLVNGHVAGRRLRQRATSCLEQVGLSGRLRHRPRELSGGEQQRVAIARALVNEPKILCCDEPTGNLDSETGRAIATLLVELRRRTKTAVLLVTHEAALAGLADAQLVLRDGRFVR